MRLTDLNSGREIGANCMLAEFGGLRLVFDCGLHPKLDAASWCLTAGSLAGKTL